MSIPKFGTVAVIVVSDITAKLLLAAVPVNRTVNITLVAPVNPLPFNVIVAPPAA